MQAVSSRVQRQAALAVEAQQRISKWLQPTPCLLSRQSAANGNKLYLKAENFLRSGSFKYRGALAKLTTLSADTPIITASSGNHGLALATAASVTGHRLQVVLPETVVEEKHQKISALGVETFLHSEDAGVAELHAQQLAREKGLVYVSPYNDESVVAGQGTVALELLQQLADIDTVFVSMGGGGLISGIGSVLKAYSPQTRIVGVSAANSAALAASMRAGRVVEVKHSPTLADGCAGSIAEDAITLALANEVVDDLLECTEQEIADGIQSIAWTEKMLVEGSAGLAYAAYKKFPGSDAAKCVVRNVGTTQVVILCGANFDREMLQPVVTPPIG